MKNFLFAVFALGLSALSSPAATLQLPTTGTLTQEVSGSLTLVDPGGISGNYPNNCNVSILLIPSNPANYLKVTFTSLSMASTSDVLTFYNDAGFGSSMGTVSAIPYEIYSDHPYGLLGMKFTSNATGVSSGFAIQVEEVAVLPPLDYQINSITPSATITEGKNMSIACSVTNNGTLNRRVPWTVYFSLDTLLDAGDEFFVMGNGSYCFNGQTINVSGTISNLPVEGGNYHLFVKLDAANTYAEVNEVNNVLHIPVTVQAATIDLQPTTTAAYTLHPGEPGSMGCSIYNNGNTNAGPFVNAFYLSADTIPEENELVTNPLATNAIAGLNSYSTVTPFSTLHSMENLAPGEYYLIVRIDYFNAVEETNEANNIKYFPLTVVEPDAEMRVTVSGTFPLVTTKQVNQTVGGTIYLEGTTYVTSIDYEYYLSTDTILDSNDEVMGRGNTGGSGPVAYLGAEYYIPDYLTVGTTYYGLVKVDPDNQYYESNENNNVAWFPISIIAQTFDFYPQVSATPPTGVAGVNGTIHVDQMNAGNYDPTTACIPFLYAYFSTDNVLDASDEVIFAGRDNSPDIIYTPAAAGNYYLIFVADAQSEFAELNEINNKLVVPFTVYPAEVDLTVSFNLYSTALIKGIYTNYNITISNLGHMESPEMPFPGKFYLSADNVFSPATDEDLGGLGWSTITMGPVSAYSNTGSLAVGVSSVMPAGSYYVLAVMDPDNLVAESDETNNVSAKAVTVADLNMDFAITPIGVSGSAGPNIIRGNAFKLTGTLYNYSNVGTSVPSAYYYSTNNILDGLDILLDNFTNGMAASDDYLLTSHSATTMPSSIPVGPGYIIAKADHLNYTTESDETNNTQVVAVNILPRTYDLDIMSVTITDTANYARGLLNGNFSVKNWGNSSVSTGAFNVYVSPDTVFSITDIFLGTVPGVTLGSSGVPSSLQTLSFTNLVLNDTTGNVYLLIVADPASAIAELNETNNTGHAAFTINPAVYDIEATGYNLPSSYVYPAVGNTVTVICTNKGLSYVNPMDVSLYLSVDMVLDPGDALLASPSFSPAGFIPGAVYNAVVNYTVPAGTPDGIYYLVAKVDHSDIYAETDETNNYTEAIRINVKAAFNDLFPDQDIPYEEIHTYPGDGITYYEWISNMGPLKIATVNNRCYFSNDTIINAGDVLMGTTTVSNCLPYTSNTFGTISVSVPAATVPGVYYLLWETDYTSTVPETNETNNVSITRLYVEPAMPDLVPDTLIIRDTLIEHNYAKITCMTANIGNYHSSNSATHLFASLDTVPDASDVLVETFSYFSISSTTSQIEIQDTLALAPGDYYFYLKADNTFTNTESDETNNTWFYPHRIHVKPAVFDLVMDHIIVNPGDAVNVISEGSGATAIMTGVRNQGNARIRYVKHYFFLSPDDHISGGDYVFNNLAYVGYLEGAGVRSMEYYYNINSGFPSGYYYLIDSVVTPSGPDADYSNNVNSVLVYLDNKRVDLAFKTPYLPDPAISYGTGDDVEIFGYSSKVINNGNYVSLDCAVRIYFSSDTLVDAGDQLMHTYFIPALYPGNTQSLSSYLFSIPGTTVAGRYYLLTVIDEPHVNTMETRLKNNVLQYEFLYKGFNNDVELYALDAPSIMVNGDVDLQASVRNNTLSTNNSIFFRAYLSTDATLSVADALVGSTVVNFSPGLDTLLDCHYNISTLPMGSYYLICKIDAVDGLDESNEGNNILVKLISYSPDGSLVMEDGLELDPCALGVTTVYDDGGIANYTRPQNTYTGLHTSPGQYFEITSSLVEIKTGDTLYIYNDSMNTTLLGKYSGTTAVNVISSGPYARLFLQALSGADSHQGYELNVNCITATLPNLYLLSSMVDDLSAPGDDLHVKVKVKNLGASFGAPFTTRFYISDDMVMDFGTDVMIANHTYSGLDLDSVIEIEEDILLPATLTTGNKYFIAYTDFNSQINEYMETDNMLMEPVELGTIGTGTELNQALQVKVYPNPAQANVRVEVKGAADKCEAVLFDALGQKIYAQVFSGVLNVPVNQLANGVYTLSVASTGEIEQVVKLVVSH